MSTRKERLRTQVTALLGSGGPALTHRQIAEALDCSTKTVQRIQRDIRPDMDEVKEKLAAYQRLLRKEMPLEHRAKRYRELVDQNEQLMVALKALERVDSIQFGRVQDETEPPKPAPMFSLPAGSRVAIVVPSVHDALAGTLDVTHAVK